MKVFYDSQIFSSHARGGIAKYFAQLVTSVDRYGWEPYLPYHFSLNQHYFELGGHDLIRIPYFRGSRKICRLLNDYVPISKRAHSFDIWHSTYYDVGLLKKFELTAAQGLVTTIHDMIPELFPQHFSANPHDGKKEYAAASDHIIAVSENTKRDIVKHYGIDPARIAVIHHGIAQENLALDSIKTPERFILFVGARSGYKNFENFLAPFSRLSKKHPGLRLLCVGGGEFSATERDRMRTLGLDNVDAIRATDAQLRYLFKKALFFVYPSIYEGFGIPILEAMAQGCPVVISNTSSFPEVAGEAAIYFDPTSPDSMCEALEVAEGDTALRQKNVEIGASIVKHYSTQNMVRQTAEVYNQLAK